MRLEFCGPDEGEEATLETGFLDGIPPGILTAAQSFGIALPAGRIVADQEGRELFVHLSGFSDLLHSRLIDPFGASYFHHRELLKSIRKMVLTNLLPKKDPRQNQGHGDQSSAPSLGFNDPAVLRYLLLRERLELSFREMDKNPVRALTCLRTTDDLNTTTYTISDTIEITPDIGEIFLVQASSQIVIRTFSIPAPMLAVELDKYMKEERFKGPSKIPTLLVFHSDIREIDPSSLRALTAFCRRPLTACLILKDNYSQFECEVNTLHD